MRPAQTARHHPVRCLLAGLRFLTILPTFSSSEHDARYLPGSLYFFTVIGFILGIAAAGFCSLLMTGAPVLVSAALLAILLSFFSGFLHLDGLADTADGFLSSRPAEKCLAIMRDSRVGVMGAAAVSALFLIKTAALASINTSELMTALVIAPAAGRTSILCLMALLPYARDNKGLGALFYSGSTRSAALFSLLFFVVVSGLIAPRKIVLIVVTVIVFTLGFALLCRRRIGGSTGDTLGAVCELTEAAVLLAFSLSTD